MITHISVDGFKSLHEFELGFMPGLNILVGPNGSGKTNIVSFFEFLTFLLQMDASEATSRAGGAGAVFRREGEEYSRNISAKISGCASIPDQARVSSVSQLNSPIFLQYEYSFTLAFPETRDAVLFQKQRLQLRSVKKFTDQHAASKLAGDWDVDLEMSISEDFQPFIKAHLLDFAKLNISFYFGDTTQTKAKKSLEKMLAGISSVNLSLINALARFSPGLWSMLNDISTGQIYNIVPSRIKMSEDSAKPPGIARDGSGLAATLYAIQKNQHDQHLQDWLYGSANPTFRLVSMEVLKSYLELVNSSIENILVKNDTFDNQLKVRFGIKSGEYSAIVPMSLMSDGTLKWMALVTAALTSTALFSVEEPENYLHPRMQGQIVGILRDILFDEDRQKFTLMTTHSETLLNHCKPEELIIVSMLDGKTVATRCSNALEVSDEINRTGFGLGYYYISDALL